MWVDIHLPKGSFFPEMIIDTVVPMADDLPVYEFCYQRVKIKHMGSNLKCVETPEANFEVRDLISVVRLVESTSLVPRISEFCLKLRDLVEA